LLEVVVALIAVRLLEMVARNWLLSLTWRVALAKFSSVSVTPKARTVDQEHHFGAEGQHENTGVDDVLPPLISFNR
jgi:hypothetical protein